MKEMSLPKQIYLYVWCQVHELHGTYMYIKTKELFAGIAFWETFSSSKFLSSLQKNSKGDECFHQFINAQYSCGFAYICTTWLFFPRDKWQMSARAQLAVDKSYTRLSSYPCFGRQLCQKNNLVYINGCSLFSSIVWRLVLFHYSATQVPSSPETNNNSRLLNPETQLFFYKLFLFSLQTKIITMTVETNKYI